LIDPSPDVVFKGSTLFVEFLPSPYRGIAFQP